MQPLPPNSPYEMHKLFWVGQTTQTVKSQQKLTTTSGPGNHHKHTQKAAGSAPKASRRSAQTGQFPSCIVVELLLNLLLKIIAGHLWEMPP